jgi:hypothetical protein
MIYSSPATIESAIQGRSSVNKKHAGKPSQSGQPASANESAEVQRLKLTIAELTLQLEQLKNQSRRATAPTTPWQPRRSMA